jgi:rod shape-determining protein MreC
MSKRPQVVAFVVVAMVSLVLLNLPDQLTGRVKTLIGGCFLPLFGLVGSLRGLAGEASAQVTPRAELLQRLREHDHQIQSLQLELARSRAVDDENQRLRQLVGWQQSSPWKTKVCRVLARDPSNWWRTLQIEAGTREGLRPGLPVLVPEGLVGRLDRVGFTASEVVLVGDPKCRVSVVVRETGETGILSVLAQGVLDHRLVDMTHLPRNTALRPGQTVYTSGLGGVFPAGIPVGAVVDSRSVSYGLYAEARVKLGADTSRIREVIVLQP